MNKIITYLLITIITCTTVYGYNRTLECQRYGCPEINNTETNETIIPETICLIMGIIFGMFIEYVHNQIKKNNEETRKTIDEIMDGFK